MAEPVTPDREAHYCVRLGQECTHACPECNEDAAFRVEIRRRVNDPGSFVKRLGDESLGNWQTRAVLPLLTDALDRARRQGRDEAADAIQAEWERLCGEPWQVCEVYGIAARLARGGPNRKDDE